MTNNSHSSFRQLNLTLYLLYAVGPIVGNSVLTLLSPIAFDFSVTPTAILIAIPAFMIPFSIIQLFSGALSDIYGRSPVIIGGLVIYGLGLVLTGFAQTLEMFVIGNLVSGFGFGFTNPVLLTLLTDTASRIEIPKRMGIAGALASFSVGLGPFLAGFMAVINWRLFYVLFFGIVVLGMFIILFSQKPVRVVHHASIRLLFQNMAIELKRPVVLFLLAASFFISMSYLATLIWTSTGLAGAVDQSLIGIMLLGVGISGALAGIVLSVYGKPERLKPITVIGLVMQFLALAILYGIGDITATSAIPFVALALVVAGWAGGTLFPVTITFSQILSPERRGVLAGIVTFANFIGVSIVPAVYAPIYHVSISLLFLTIFASTIVLALLFAVLFHFTRSLRKPMVLTVG